MITLLSANAWIKLRINQKVIHIDPGFIGAYKTYGQPKEVFEEPADLVLISHEHTDHLQPSILKKIIKPDTLVVAPMVCDSVLAEEFLPCKPGDIISFFPFSIQIVPAYNTVHGHSTQKNHAKDVGVGFILKTPQYTFYHAGDTDLIPEMEDFPEIHIAFLPIGGTYTMDIDEAVKTAFVLQSDTIIPMHFLDADPKEFKKKVEEQSPTKVILLQPGEGTDLTPDSD